MARACESNDPSQRVKIIELTTEPEIAVVPAPSLDPESERIMLRHRAELEAAPGRFDGPNLMGVSIAAGRIEAFASSFAHWCACEDPRFDSRSLGQIGVSLLISDGSEGCLWQKRSAHVVSPGCWWFAAGGGLDPSSTVGQALDTELSEELGLSRSDLLDLEPLAICEQDPGVLVVYAARLAPDAELRPSPDEVELLEWGELEGPPKARSNDEACMFAGLARIYRRRSGNRSRLR